MAQFDVYKYDMIFGGLGKQTTTAFYYRQAEADGSNGRLIADALRPLLRTQLWTAYLKDVMSASMELLGDRCQLWGPTKDAPSIDSTSGGVAVLPGGALPNSTAVIITKYPGTWDKDFFCRNFLPGLDETAVVAGLLTSAYQDMIQATADTNELATIAMTVPETLNFDQVCLSPKRQKAFNPATDEWTDVYSLLNSVKVQPRLGTQSSRRMPHGSDAI